MSARLVDLVTRPHRQMVDRYLALWDHYQMLGLPTDRLASVIAWHERKIAEAEGQEVQNTDSIPKEDA